MAEFEAAFPYEETPDQLAAIEAVKHDMSQGKPMDRLICGDVGYGKTEVAIRAAFKAVDAGKQVAVLVPTTILAEQHHRSFSSRMAAIREIRPGEQYHVLLLQKMSRIGISGRPCSTIADCAPRQATFSMWMSRNCGVSSVTGGGLAGRNRRSAPSQSTAGHRGDARNSATSTLRTWPAAARNRQLCCKACRKSSICDIFLKEQYVV